MMLIASIGYNEKLIPKNENDIDHFIDRIIEFNTKDSDGNIIDNSAISYQIYKTSDHRRYDNPEYLKMLSTKAQNPQRGVGGTNLPILAQGTITCKSSSRINMDNNEMETIKKKSMNKIGLKIVSGIVGYFTRDFEYTLDDARVFIANPDPAIFRSIFNLSDIPIITNIRSAILLDKIRHNLRFYF
jgi:hypothetical protein